MKLPLVVHAQIASLRNVVLLKLELFWLIIRTNKLESHLEPPSMNATQGADVDLIVPIGLYKKAHDIHFASFELAMAVAGV
jgi:hypothetical protein